MAKDDARGTHETPDSDGKQRLQRVMADAGVAARRVCEAYIEEGRVRVNGQTVTRLPIFVDPEVDSIEVDGRVLPKAQRHVYVMLNKPEGVLVTAADEPGMDRTTVLDLVKHPAGVRLFPIGRLDWETRGLVLLTNDGELANKLTHPKYEVAKTYEAVVRGGVDQAAADAIALKLKTAAQAADMETGRVTRAKKSPPPVVRVVKGDQERTLIEITIVEARNRLLRDVLKMLGMPVKKLTRTRIGGVELRELGPAMWRELTREEIQALRTFRPVVRPRGPALKRGARPNRGAGRPRRGPMSSRAGGFSAPSGDRNGPNGRSNGGRPSRNESRSDSRGGSGGRGPRNGRSGGKGGGRPGGRSGGGAGGGSGGSGGGGRRSR